MYHEQTIRELAQRRRRRFIFVVALALVCLLLVAVVRHAQTSASEQGAQSLRSSIVAAATRCYAVEGQYPASLEYLEDHYGLRVNRQSYAVTYEAFASNVMPSVVVVAR